MTKHKIAQLLLEKLGQPVTLLTPKDEAHGDYAFNVHQLKTIDPGQLTVDLSKNQLFEKVEQVGSFINLSVNRELLVKEVEIIQEEKDLYGKKIVKTPQRIHLEYGQPNTHKLPHIGHLFSYVYGESLARILEATGNTVFRANYQGDVGPHVAKCLYVILKEKIDTNQAATLSEKVMLLQRCYQTGSQLYDENETAKKEIDELNKKIYLNDLSTSQLWQTTRQWSLDYYELFEKQLGIHYDKHYFESVTGPIGKKIVEDNMGSVFEKSDGAIVFKGEKHGAHTRVFITKTGNPTYEAKDIGNEYLKYQDWPFDQAIITTASEQNGYFKVVIAAINESLPEMKGKVSHLGFGMIDLKKGKMSSRTGNILSAMDLVGAVKKIVLTLIKIPTQSDNDKEIIADTVALGAIKYSFLKSDAKKNISFDLEASVSTAGNSGPYIQYAYARCMSILKKASVIANNSDVIPANAGIYTNRSQVKPGMTTYDKFTNEELALLRSFFRFGEVVENAANTYSPHVIATYLFDLTQKFNVFYEKCSILKAEKDSQVFRLRLTTATAQLLKNGLYLLGIDILEHI